MSEALGLLFAHASTLGVTRLTADIDADNAALSPCLKNWASRRMQGAISARSPLSDPTNPLTSQAVVAKHCCKKQTE
ncbi:TPA: hypothetical protein ACSP2Y_001846 [Aeromonas veronii]